jgi:hypothetical protein
MTTAKAGAQSPAFFGVYRIVINQILTALPLYSMFNIIACLFAGAMQHGKVLNATSHSINASTTDIYIESKDD